MYSCFSNNRMKILPPNRCSDSSMNGIWPPPWPEALTCDSKNLFSLHRKFFPSRLEVGSQYWASIFLLCQMRWCTHHGRPRERFALFLWGSALQKKAVPPKKAESPRMLSDKQRRQNPTGCCQISRPRRCCSLELASLSFSSNLSEIHSLSGQQNP